MIIKEKKSKKNLESSEELIDTNDLLESKVLNLKSNL